MKKKLIIFSHGGGRMANQMTNHAHLIAFQKEHGSTFEVINIAFGPFSNLFGEMQSDKIPRLPSESMRMRLFTNIIARVVQPREYKMSFFNLVLRFIHLLFAFLPFTQSIKYGPATSYLNLLPGKSVENSDLNDPDFISLLSIKGISLLAGWPVRSWTLFRKYEAEIRSSLKIREDYMRNADNFIKPIKSKCDLLVGVLIRQGDYRTWAKGKYFFHTEKYVDVMRQVENIFSGKKVGFIVASDEKQDTNKFENLNVFFTTGSALGSAHFIESFAELSSCQYVLTPPSTFGAWAAFLGDVPIIPFCESGQNLKIDDLLENHIYDCLGHPHMSVSIS